MDYRYSLKIFLLKNIGHSYVVYGPLCNAATVVLYDGIPTYPDASRYWKIVDEYKVTQFYTAPTGN